MVRMGRSSSNTIEIARNQNTSWTQKEMGKTGSTSCKTYEMGPDENNLCKLEWDAQNARYFM